MIGYLYRLVRDSRRDARDLGISFKEALDVNLRGDRVRLDEAAKGLDLYDSIEPDPDPWGPRDPIVDRASAFDRRLRDEVRELRERAARELSEGTGRPIEEAQDLVDRALDRELALLLYGPKDGPKLDG